MTLYFVTTNARASIEEFWTVEADGTTEARQKVERGQGQIICDSVIGEEEDRYVTSVEEGAGESQRYRLQERLTVRSDYVLDLLKLCLAASKGTINIQDLGLQLDILVTELER